jgi:hypothetical protein
LLSWHAVFGVVYIKAIALAVLESTIGWLNYGRKYDESIFTIFYQNYYLPTNFGYEKRRPHLSRLIVSGQISRNEALENLKEPLYESQVLENEIHDFCKKMRISRKKVDDFITAPAHHYTDFPNGDNFYPLLKKIQSLVERSLGRNLRV